MNVKELLSHIENGGLDAGLGALYGESNIGTQKARYAEAVTEFAALYGEDREVSLYSVPGRSEIAGNHTDHNRGCVIAAAVDLDIIAVVAKREDDIITVKSKGFPADTVPCHSASPDESKYFTSEALLAGVCAGFEKRGYRVCGFDAYTTSSVLKGSGISSSAAFEVMIGNILNYLTNEGAIPNAILAEIAQFAENVYFGKPSGLMDQTACAVGGFSFIDFADPAAAEIEKLDFDLSDAGYSLCITNTGGNHADLNEDYAAVPAEMKAVAAELGRPVLRGLTRDELLAHTAELREKHGDRAILRAFHFLGENERVQEQAERLRRGDLEGFLAGIHDSGRSSFMWLQNVYTTKNIKEQGLSLALAVTEHALRHTTRPAAWRLHGGGFAGTIQAFVPNEEVSGYKAALDAVFGKDACAVLRVRREGAIKVF